MRLVPRSARLAAALSLIGASILPNLAWAHPGHDAGGFLAGFLHPMLGLDHLLAAFAVGMWAARSGARALWSVPLAFVAMMTAGAALAWFGFTLPGAEPLIAASVLLLGLLLALQVKLPASAGILMVALFAPFHGAGHIAEPPATSGLLAYVAGLLLATAALHVSGIVTAVALRARPLLVRLAAAPIAIAGGWLLLARIG